MKSLISPFDAYKGNEHYIFVSYAHRNSEIVFRHITRLREEGFRIWYDEGIDPGTDWSDEIAKALVNSTTFLVFVSPEMVESHNVKKEIVFALSRKKHMIAAHIAETTLPDGLDMQLSNIQALLENRFIDKEKFYEQLFASLPATTRGDKTTATNNNKTSKVSLKSSWLRKLFAGDNKVSEQQIIEDSNIKIKKLTRSPTSARPLQINTTDSNKKTIGIEINGVIWAPCNVDVPGTFAANPEDTGMFYQWNRKKAWPTTGEVSDWDYTVPEGDTWEKSNDPSPAGWRVPTDDEVDKLLDKEKVTDEWITLNGIKGKKFTDKTNDLSIFLPVAGYRVESCKIYIDPHFGLYGSYWNREQEDDNCAHGLEFFGNGYADNDGWFGKKAGRLIRPVVNN